FLITPRMPKPPYLTTMAFPLKQAQYTHLATLPGVAEIAIAEVENLLYVKFDKQKITIPELRNAVEAGTLAES
ncbi:MAG TPA: hypothetical protein VI844_00915, partial [Coxiellaceae bacterium]|nr:hypothetical protein [Coxiellaceae bacterium]